MAARSNLCTGRAQKAYSTGRPAYAVYFEYRRCLQGGYFERERQACSDSRKNRRKMEVLARTFKWRSGQFPGIRDNSISNGARKLIAVQDHI